MAQLPKRDQQFETNEVHRIENIIDATQNKYSLVKKKKPNCLENMLKHFNGPLSSYHQKNPETHRWTHHIKLTNTINNPIISFLTQILSQIHNNKLFINFSLNYQQTNPFYSNYNLSQSCGSK